MPPALLAFFYLALTIGPLAIAALWFPERRSVMNEIASGLGLAAFSIILIDFVLSGRFQVVSRGLGIDVTMRFHQLFARTAAVFAILHPFLYQGHMFRRPLPWDSAGLHAFGLDFTGIAAGIAAWILLCVFILAAIFRDRLPYKHETWRLMHGIGAALIVGLVAYHAWNGGRYSSEAPLSWIWAGLVAIAALTLFVVYLGRPLRQIARRYRVTSVRKIADRTWELAIRSNRAAGARFKAGQFVWLNVGHSPFTLYENPFSIASAPNESGEMSFVIKEAGDFTRSLGSVEPGTRAYIDGPYGNLTIDGREADGIGLIGGGVGIAPLLSVVRQMRDSGDPRPAILAYGNRHRGQIVYEDELRSVGDETALRVEFILQDPPEDWDGRTGMLDPATIKDIFGFEGADRWLYLLCGPPGMLETAETALLELGVPPKQILSERFYYD